MTTHVLEREETLTRAYEHALCSPFARGVQLTRFHFDLPRPDDVLTLPNGTNELRMHAEHHHGYSQEELAAHELYAQHQKHISFPPIFAEDAETILELHLSDLQEIARGITRDAHMRRVAIIAPQTFHTFAGASFAFHEALLQATATLFSLSEPKTATVLLHGGITERLFSSEETLRLAVRRMQHSPLVHVLEAGIHAQLVTFFTHGRDLGSEPDFFAHHLRNFLT